MLFIFTQCNSGVVFFSMIIVAVIRNTKTVVKIFKRKCKECSDGCKGKNFN